MKEARGRSSAASRLYPSLWSDRWYHLSALRKVMEQVVAAHLAGSRNGILLDLGCGNSPYRSLFEPHVDRYITLDLSENGRADFCVSPQGESRLPAGVADVVLSTQVLEHVSDPARYLDECFRLLKPGGLLVLSTHGHWMYHPDPSDYWRWTSSGLRRILERSGFRVVDFHGVMNLAAMGIQLFQDAVRPKVPGLLRVPLTVGSQLGIAAADRLALGRSREEDAGVFVTVSRKGGCGNGTGRSACGAGRGDFAVPVSQGTVRLSEDPGELPAICVLSPNRSAYSETFIRAHIERLPARLRVLYGGGFPDRTEEDKPLLSPRPLARLGRALIRRVTGCSERDFQVRSLRRFLRRNRVAVVLAEYGPTGVAVMEACRRAEIPLVVHFHGGDAYQSQVLARFQEQYRRLFFLARAVIAVSREMEERLLEWGAPRETLHYCPYGVDTRLFSGADPESAPPVFVAAGRFVEKKAPHLTLLAFREVLKVVPGARLQMVGDGPLWGACRQMAQSLKLSRQVEFLGPRPHAEVALLMRQARAFVQHSVKAPDGDSEGTPLAVLEASSSGLPVVSTRHAGISDVVVHEGTGYLVEEGDVAAMAVHMTRLAQDSKQAALLGRRGRARILSEFSMETSIRRLWQILAEAAGLKDKESPVPVQGLSPECST